MSAETYLYNNLIGDLSAIAATEEAATYEIENTSDDWKYPSYTWRTAGDISDILVTIDMGAATAVAAFALININFSAATTCSVRKSTDNFAANDDLVGNMTIITRTLNGTARYDAYLLTAANTRYYRFYITLAAGSYVEAGSIFLADDTYTVTESAHQYPMGRDILASKNEDGVFTGHVTRKVNAQRSPIGLSYTGIAEAQRAILYDTSESDNCCFLPTGAAGDIYFGFTEFAQATAIDPRIATPIFNLSGSFTEVFA